MKTLLKVTIGFALCTTSARNVNAQAFVDDEDGLLDVGEALGGDLASLTGELNLFSRDIEDLDGTKLLTGLQSINLRSNAITSIERGDFDGLGDLQRLLLAHNDIASIEPSGFEGLDNLELLSLDHNSITGIESGDFDGLENLHTLFLGWNEIASIEQGDFDGLKNLRRLTLWSNPITTIEPGAFSDLKELQFLGIGGRLQDIDAGLFEGLTSLQHLAVTAELSSIESEDFASVPGLTELDLRWNEIVSVGDAFAGLPNLEVLELGGNSITSIQPMDLDGQPKLKRLGLNSNAISRIDAEAFDGLTGLKELDLAANDISSIEPGAFADMVRLETLVLVGNDLTELDLTRATFEHLQLPRGGPFAGPLSGFHAELLPTIVSRKISSLVLDDASLSQQSFDAVVAQLTVLTDVSVVGLTFSDANPSDLSALFDIETLDSVRVDPVLYNLYSDDFDAFAAITGNTVTVVPEPGTCLLLPIAVCACLVARSRLGLRSLPSRASSSKTMWERENRAVQMAADCAACRGAWRRSM